MRLQIAVAGMTVPSKGKIFIAVCLAVALAFVSSCGYGVEAEPVPSASDGQTGGEGGEFGGGFGGSVGESGRDAKDDGAKTGDEAKAGGESDVDPDDGFPADDGNSGSGNDIDDDADDGDGQEDEGSGRNDADDAGVGGDCQPEEGESGVGSEPEADEIDYNDGRVTVWAGGIRGPLDDELVLECAAPGLASGLFSWYETTDTQWFNVAKTLQGDSNMCWAIAATNVLHWWSARNRDNIEAFLEKNPPASEREHLYDFSYNPIVSDRYDGVEGGGKLIPVSEQMDQSRIADVFRGNSDRGIPAGVSNDAAGGYSDIAFVWYLYFGQSDAPALYRSVFANAEDAGMVRFENDVSADNFTSIIKAALDEERVLTMDFNTLAGSSVKQHCVNVWGAVFNDDGVVTELWVGDSNYKQNRIFNWKIKYKNESVYLIPAYNDAATASDAMLNKRVLYLTSFSDGSEAFRQYLGKL